MSEGWVCDACSAEDDVEPRWVCAECEYDLCQKCGASQQAAKKAGTMSAGILETYPPEYVVRMLAEAGEKDMALRFAKMFIAENFHAPLITAQMISIMHEIGADDEAMLVFDSAFRKDATLGDPGHPAWARVVPTALDAAWSCGGTTGNAV